MYRSDAQLIRRLRLNDRAAFEAVVEANYHKVYGQLWHLCHDAEVAADLTQETFARAWSSLDTFAGRSSIRTWLYTIALRCWCRWKERQPSGCHCSLEPLEDWAEAIPDQGPGPAQALEAQTQREDVQAALSRLPSPFHETVVLFYIQGLKYREVAEVLDVSMGTVKSRLHEGVKRLRAALNEAETTEAHILQGDSR